MPFIGRREVINDTGDSIELEPGETLTAQLTMAGDELYIKEVHDRPEAPDDDT